MSTSIQNMLLTLYKVSRTPYKVESDVPYPLKKNYLSNPDTVSYIKTIQDSMVVQPLKSPGVTDEDIKTVILFMLQLVNTQIDLEGVLLIKPSLEYLINEAYDEAKIAKGDADRSAIELITKEWYKKLKNNPNYTLKCYERCPDYEKSPLLSCHTVAYESCKLREGTTPFYATYAYEFHKRLRFNESLALDNDTHIGYVRSTRFFFLHCSQETKKRTDLKPNKLPTSIVKNFLTGYKASRMGHSKLEKIEETAETHKGRLHDLWHWREVPSRQRFRKGVSYSSKESDDLPSPGGILEEDPEFKSTGLPIEDDGDEKDEWDGSECNPGEDWNFASHPGEDAQTTTDKDPEIRDAKWLDRFHLRNFHFFWEAKYLDLFHYGILYHAMMALLNTQPVALNKILVIYLYLLIHTGIGSNRLLNLRGSSKAIIPETELELIKIKDRYYLLNPTLITLRTIPEPGICLPTSKKVHIPIPDSIAKLFPADILENEYIFSYVNKDKNNDKPLRLHPDSIFAFLEDVNESFKRYKLKITLPRIASSFQPLYHHRYGLDPIIACHISGKDRQRLFGAQMHYIYVEHKKLAKAYLATFNEVDFNIRRNLNLCIKNKLIKAELKPFGRDKLDVTLDDHFYGYGSPFIPKNEYIVKIIKTLRKAVENEEDIVDRHNLYTIYIYLGLQFATALRPRNKPQLPWTRFNSMAGTLLIKDKLSERFREERLLPLPRVILALVNNLKSGLNALEDFVLRNINMKEQHDRTKMMIFFIDEKGRFIPFTIKDMIERLKKIGIDYTLPPNMPRHYCRSYLHDRVSADLSDIWMGHQHLGREVMSIISSSVFADAVRICRPHIDKMMADICFAEVAYIPNDA